MKERLTKIINKPYNEAFTVIYLDRRKKPVIHVNIQKLWLDVRNVNRFIVKFAKAYNHEIIHTEIFKITNKVNNPYYEECVVRKLMSEKFNKETRKSYDGKNRKRK